jgi:hypothetical protein
MAATQLGHVADVEIVLRPFVNAVPLAQQGRHLFDGRLDLLLRGHLHEDLVDVGVPYRLRVV